MKKHGPLNSDKDIETFQKKIWIFGYIKNQICGSLSQRIVIYIDREEELPTFACWYRDLIHSFEKKQAQHL